MCGIVGLFLKTKKLEDDLGQLLTNMLVTMTDRGPDSAGVAIYKNNKPKFIKITVQSSNAKQDFADLKNILKGLQISITDTHAVIEVTEDKVLDTKLIICQKLPNIRIMSVGSCIEIYKEVGLPEQVADRFKISQMKGSHGIGHTRMATESKVTTLGAHPFSTGNDQCLVHNGSLSNHNNLRRKLIKQKMSFETENDTEVAAAYLSNEMANGSSLDEALQAGINDFDGFYTFVVGTKDGFGVVRDPIACKPAVLAETDEYVAFGSEYRALVDLPNIESAKVWEPEPATVYFWRH